MAKNIWVREPSGIYYPATQTVQAQVEPSLYDLAVTGNGKWFLQPRQVKFDIPKKIYGLETEFISRVIKSYKCSDKNLGVLLNGLKGTGKTVTGKIIANEIGLPIINITFAHPGMLDILSQIDFDAVVFIDEYEKIFQDDNRGLLLSLMDGTQKTTGKLLFILTTNSMHVNPNLIDRPSRIRYVKEYGNLSRKQIVEIVADTLMPEHKDKERDLIETISHLQSLSIDLVLEIIKETNTHGESPDRFMEFFNANKGGYKKTYLLYDISTGDEFYKIVTEGFISQYASEQSTIFNTNDHAYVTIVKPTGPDKSIFKIPNPAYCLIRKAVDKKAEDFYEIDEEKDKEKYDKVYEELTALEQKQRETKPVIEGEFKYVEQGSKHYVFID